MKPIINSEKRIPQTTLTTIAQFAVVRTDLVSATQGADVTKAIEVDVGTVVKAIYLEYWLIGGETAQGSTFTATLEKSPGGGNVPDSTTMGDLNAYENKKNILYTTQGLVAESAANPTPVIRMWIKIPKGKQRFGNGDRLIWAVKAVTGSLDMCGFAIFKAYN